MARTHVSVSVLLAAGMLVSAVCAAQPAATAVANSGTAPEMTLAEKKFQQAAKTYRMYQHEGQVVYCKKEKVLTSAVPVVQCLTETELRAQVENMRRSRNISLRPVVAGSGQGGIG